MSCFFCKGTLKDSVTAHVVNSNDCIIIVKNVPCTQCTQCGETFYDNEVTLRLERIVKEIRTAITEIAVVNYSAA